ncbi:MAG: CHAT domain-containing protein [Bacteroidia bacterium]|nr:CHAT domain-containing protein [Bacteroidia bacterium]MDW8347040.1 CHAT domain-containing tetratricopeptide repeat protein [Bacteroidia bacterium]
MIKSIPHILIVHFLYVIHSWGQITSNKILSEAQKKLEIYDAKGAKELCYKVQPTLKPNTADYFTLHQILAKSEALAGNYLTALEIWEKAHRDKNTPSYYYYKILWLKDYGAYQQAYNEVYIWQQIEKRRNTADYITANLLLIEINLLLGNYTSILPLLQETQKLIIDLYGTHHPIYYHLLAQFALYHKEVHEYKLSESYFMQALPYHKEENAVEYVHLAAHLSALYAKIGSYERSQEILHKAEERLQNTKYMPLFAFYAVLSQKIDLYQTLSNYDEVQNTLSYLEQKIVQHSHAKHPFYALTLYRKAKYLFQTAQYIEAQEHAQEALTILQEQYAYQHLQIYEVKTLLANISIALGQFETAKQILESLVLAQSEQLGYYHPLYLQNLLFLADLYRQKQLLEPAYTFIQKAYQYAQNSPNLDAATRLRIEIEYHYLKGLYSPINYSSLSWQNLIQEYLLHKQYPDVAACYIKQAEVFLQAQNHDSTRHKLYSVLSLLHQQNIYQPHIEIRANYLLAQSFSSTHPDSTLKYYQKTLQNAFNLTQSIFPYMTEHEQLLWYQKLYRIVQEYQRFSVRYHDRRQNHEYMVIFDLFCKSLLLRTHQKFSLSALQEESEDLKAYLQEWQHYKKALVQATIQSHPSLYIDSLQKNIISLERYLRRHISFEKDNPVKLYTWQEITHAIPDSSALWLNIRIPIHLDSVVYIHYLIEKKALYPKYILQTNGIYIESELLPKYKKYVKGIFDIQEQVYQTLWKPIQDSLQGITQIYYLPDGVFYQINFSTLYDAQKEEYLLMNYDFYWINHIQDISTVNNIDVFQKPMAVLFGYPDYWAEKTLQDSTRGYLQPLPGTKIEIESIKKVLQKEGWRVSVYLSDEASEENLKKIHRPTVLHIATHGFYIDNIKNRFLQKRIGISDSTLYSIPLLRSGLMLAGAEKTLEDVQKANKALNDGILLGYEAQHINLENTELVVLSACETGLGSVMAGEGIFGLQRAFEMAGAKTVMTSLWNVNDRATQLLMTYFYLFWLKYQNKQKALKMAQIAVMKEYIYPYFWGAFVLVY